MKFIKLILIVISIATLTGCLFFWNKSRKLSEEMYDIRMKNKELGLIIDSRNRKIDILGAENYSLQYKYDSTKSALYFEKTKEIKIINYYENIINNIDTIAIDSVIWDIATYYQIEL
jgi:hypothetical protein